MTDRQPFSNLTKDFTQERRDRIEQMKAHLRNSTRSHSDCLPIGNEMRSIQEIAEDLANEKVKEIEERLAEVRKKAESFANELCNKLDDGNRKRYDFYVDLYFDGFDNGDGHHNPWGHQHARGFIFGFMHGWNECLMESGGFTLDEYTSS